MEKQGWYEFSHFRLDLKKRLLFRGDEVVGITPKALEVLLVLIEHQGQLVSYGELKTLAWKESRFVEDKTLTQTIYTLRTSLGDSSTEQKYIENVPKRGYRFVAEAVFKEITDPLKTSDDSKLSIRKKRVFRQLFTQKPINHLLLIALGSGILVFGISLGIYFSRQNSPDSAERSATIEAVSDDTSSFANKSFGRVEVRSPSDEESVRKLVQESQIYESLTMYASPNSFDQNKLSEYWLPENLGGKEIIKVNSSLKRLRDKGLNYGSESKVERFEFRYVRIFSPRDYAEVGTIERWFLPLYHSSGIRVEGRNEYLGPYKVDYALRKINDKWLIEETSTPRYEEKK